MVGQTQAIQPSVSPGNCGVNIQIFNPTSCAGSPPPNNYTNSCQAPGCYPSNYYTQNLAAVPPPVAPAGEAKKKEKKDIVMLTDGYIKNLENYLNNQNTQVRLQGAKEVMARFQEDPSRKDDPALNALVNKMLQDPSQPVKFIGMSLIEGRHATGNDHSVVLLQKIQNDKTGYGEDSLKASNALLKMSAQTTQKEFDVKEKSEKK